MTKSTISVRRRQLIITGVTGPALPSLALAAWSGEALSAASAQAARHVAFVVSGRVAAAHGRPLAGIEVEARAAGGVDAGMCTTDADGRFVFRMSAPAGLVDQPQALRFGVRHTGHECVACDYSGAGRERFQRDEAGVWRTSVALSVPGGFPTIGG